MIWGRSGAIRDEFGDVVNRSTEGTTRDPQVSKKSKMSHLSVSGVMTKRGVFPRYSWLYRNCASQMFAKQSSSTLSHLKNRKIDDNSTRAKCARQEVDTYNTLLQPVTKL